MSGGTQWGTERDPIARGQRPVKEAVMFRSKLAAVGLFLIVATIVWLPPTVHAGVTAAILLLVLLVPIVRRWFTDHVN
jgi:UPF0716 family protein affecting phage T7 exclusion